MSSTTRKAILRKLDRVKPTIENAQQHVLDCIATYLELADHSHTLEDFLSEDPPIHEHRYGMQISGLITILHLLEEPLNSSETIIELIKKM